MKSAFETFKSDFKKFNIYQKIAMVVLLLAIPLCLGMGVSAVSGGDDDTTPPVVRPSPSPEATAEPTASPSPTPRADVEIFLVPASVEEDLEVQIMDKNDELVKGPEFFLTVQGVKNGYKKVWTVNDGFLKLTKLSSGDYTVTIDEKDGFIIKDRTVEITVAKKIDYEKIDVSDKVVDESQIDVSKEDAAFDDQTSPAMTPAPPPKDTVEYVKSSSKKEIKDVEVITYKYKPVLLEDKTIRTKDGKSSGLYAVTDSDGYLVSAYKLLYPTPTPSPRTAALDAQSLGPVGILLKTFAVENENIPAVIDEDEGEQTQPTAEPTAEPTPRPTPVPTREPTPAPTAEPTPALTAEPTSAPTAAPTEAPAVTATPVPTTEPTAAPTARPTTEPTSEPTVRPTAQPTETPLGTPAPTVAPTATPAPTVTPAPTSTPQPEKEEVKIFDEEGLLLESLNLKVETKEIVTTEKREVTVYKGWQTIEGKKYYFDKNGNMVTGTQIIQGITYYFDKNGVMGNRIGIDVSKYQRNIDWKEVKKAGIEFAIIRAGYRGYGSGALVEDPYFKQNLKGAKAAGIKVGVYIFSQAITTAEAVEEASLCLDLVKGYKLEYPIFFDTEYSTSRKTGRADKLSQSARTKIAKAFCETIENSGYNAGIYASKSWFYYQLDYSQISKYDIWVAHYASSTDFKHRYDIWQYTGSGTCAGVPGAVDMNIGYTAY